MYVAFAPEVDAVVQRLPDHPYERLWDVLDRILLDPEGAKVAPWTNYVSSHQVYGSKIPGTDYIVYWQDHGDELWVAHLLEDIGL